MSSEKNWDFGLSDPQVNPASEPQQDDSRADNWTDNLNCSSLNTEETPAIHPDVSDDSPVSSPQAAASAAGEADSNPSHPHTATPGAIPPQPPFPGTPGAIPPGYIPSGGPGGYPPPPVWPRSPQTPSGGIGKFLVKLFLCLLGIVVAMGTIMFLGVACLTGLATTLNQIETQPMPVSEKTLSGSKLSSSKVVILPIEGVIEGKEDGFIRKAIRQAQEDDRVAGVVLRINSPGGTMSGSDYYHYLLKDLKSKKEIPIVVSMGGIAASGGYYISTIGDKIFAEPSTLTGSIGVIIPLYNAADLCKKIGVGSSAVTSGAMKGMGDFTKPMGNEEKAIWQNLVNTSYEQFLKVIKEGRPVFRSPSAKKENADSDKTKDSPTKDSKPKDSETKETISAAAGAPAPVSTVAQAKPLKQTLPTKSEAELRKIADGRIYTAQDALKLGLIDEIGFLDAAVREVIKLAEVDEADVQVVRYRSPTGFAALLSESESTARAANITQIVSDMSTPGVWCICPRLIPVKNEK